MFSGASAKVTGYFDVLVTFGAELGVEKIQGHILIVESNNMTDNTYNMIIGRPILNTLGVIVSTPHLVMKFPLKQISTVHTDQQEAR